MYTNNFNKKLAEAEKLPDLGYKSSENDKPPASYQSHAQYKSHSG